MLVQMAKGTLLVTKLVINTWTGEAFVFGLPEHMLCPTGQYMDASDGSCNTGFYNRVGEVRIPTEVDFDGDGAADTVFLYDPENDTWVDMAENDPCKGYEDDPTC